MTKRARAQARIAALRLREQRFAARAQAERRRHKSIDALFEMVDRDAEVGGGIMAGALAYRLFIWLLPLALVGIAGLGFASRAASESPTSAARSSGLGGIVSSSVASAASSSARWYALLIGIPILLFTTRGVLQALIVSHRLVWTDLRERAPAPSLRSTVRLLGALVALLAISVLASALRHAYRSGGLLATLAAIAPYAGIWLVISERLPHRDATRRGLVPGALLFGVGIEVLHLVTVYYLAAALLLNLFLLSRLAIAAAVVSATLWERRSRP
jgi:uncharacterized BrkB/YihY/UPF0761 family membrane protein